MGALLLIQLRNPWGSREWQGDYSDSSALWTRELRVAIQAQLAAQQRQSGRSGSSEVKLDGNDGIFWMSFSDL